MPGKVNPTQCEAMVMVCIQVLGDDTAMGMAGSQGNFQLNAMRPIIVNNFLHSARILGDSCEKFRLYCIDGIDVNEKQITDYVNRSLMLVTALSPVIGYDNASAIAHDADRTGRTLRESAIDSGLVTAEEFDRVVVPSNMVGPF
jgi:fumarate hydratase class II